MKCWDCQHEFHIADAWQGMGDPATPGTLLIGGVVLTLCGVSIMTIGLAFRWTVLAVLGGAALVALPLAVTYIPNSMRVYCARDAGKCPRCGRRHSIRFWST